MQPRQRRSARYILPWLPLALGVLSMACGEDSGEPSLSDPQPNGDPPPSGDAQPGDVALSDSGAVGDLGPVAAAYAALSRGELARLPQLIDDLDAAVQQDPSDGRSAFYAGTMRLWKLGEAAQGLSIAEMAPFALPMIERLQEAQQLLPDDPRVPAFLGLARVRVGLTLGSAEMIDAGLGDLAEGIERLPAYGHFLRASATNGAAADTSYYETVVSDMQAVAEHCGYEKDGRGTYAYLEGPLDAARYVCNNDGIVPHVWEGLFTTFGDVVLKAGGEPAAARALYESAEASPTFDEWPFAHLLRERIEQAEERAILYADGDFSNDPPVWTDGGHVCVGCHQRRQ